MQDFINGLPIAAVILLLLAGFAFLVKGADLFVEGSSSIARKLKVAYYHRSYHRSHGNLTSGN